MKKLLTVVAIGGSLLACKKEDTTGKAAATIGQAFDLADQQTIAVPTGGGTPLSLRLAKVLDSRCPVGMVCVSAGSAGVEVELTDAAAPQTARLCLRQYVALPGYSLDSVAVVLNRQSYWLRLLAIAPYPGTGSQTKTATLRLRPY